MGLDILELSQKSEIKPLFMPLKDLRSVSTKQLGNQFDILSNINMNGFYKDNFVDFNDLAEVSNPDFNHYLQGLIYKVDVNN